MFYAHRERNPKHPPDTIAYIIAGHYHNLCEQKKSELFHLESEHMIHTHIVNNTTAVAFRLQEEIARSISIRRTAAMRKARMSPIAQSASISAISLRVRPVATERSSRLYLISSRARLSSEPSFSPHGSV